MPHIVIAGPLKFESIYREFKKEILKIDDKTIIKYTDCFFNKDKNIILINTIIIENQRPMSFYIMIMAKENQITIRLDPYNLSGKNIWCEKSLALIARKILEKGNHLKITKTNLQDFVTQ